VRFAGGVLYTKRKKGGGGGGARCLGGGEVVDVESGGAQMLNIRLMMRRAIKSRATSIIWRIMTANEASHFSDDSSSDAGRADAGADGGGDGGGE